MAKRRPSIATLLDRLPRQSGFLLAVSGGKDSMCLLDAVVRFARAQRVEVCHIDHRFREDSGDDARFVASQCDVRGVPCHVSELSALPPGANLESWARRERYRVLCEIREQRGLDWILTAHTANDVAETLLMRLLSNKELSNIEELEERRRCLRPLLGASRAQIEAYVAVHSVPFRDDPSNADTAFLRNRVRHELIPLLESRFDPSVVWSLADRGLSLHRDLAALEEQARREADAVGPVRWNDSAWLQSARQRLGELPEALRWRVLEALFLPVVRYPLGERKARSILGLLSGASDIVTLEGGLSLRIDNGCLTQNL